MLAYFLISSFAFMDSSYHSTENLVLFTSMLFRIKLAPCPCVHIFSFERHEIEHRSVSSGICIHFFLWLTPSCTLHRTWSQSEHIIWYLDWCGVVMFSKVTIQLLLCIQDVHHQAWLEGIDKHIGHRRHSCCGRTKGVPKMNYMTF